MKDVFKMMIESNPNTNPDETVYKMYVFVRTDIPYVHQAVQAGHAVAEYLIRNGKPNNWHNGIMVYLGVENELALVNIERNLISRRLTFSGFMEPDWSVNPQLTAIAIVAADGTFPNHQTVKMDCGWRKFKRKVLSWMRK